MELTKDFVISCRKLNILRDFLCQAIDQVDEKDKEIESLKKELSNLKSETKVMGTPESIAEQICEALPIGAYIITVTPPMTSNPEDIVEMISKDVPVGTSLSTYRWNKTYSIESTKEEK